MKRVDIPQLIIKQYSNGEVLHYIASELRELNNVALADKEWNNFAFGSVMAKIEGLNVLASALDKKMNGDNGASIVV